jgi:hypothetical protein
MDMGQDIKLRGAHLVFIQSIPHRIHGAGIYANMTGV